MDPEGHWDRSPLPSPPPSLPLPSCEALVWPGVGAPNRAWTLTFLFLKLPFPHWGHPLYHPTVRPAPVGI